MHNKLITCFLVLMFTLIFVGCSNKKDESANEKLSVYTTIFPLADFTKKIGGDYVNVETIYPPGADSHTYEPSQQQTVQVAKADLFVYNGVELEPFAEKMEKTLKKEKVKTINASKDLTLISSFKKGHSEHEEEHHHHHDKDPHVWLDPMLAMKQAEKIKDALIELQPNHKKEFDENFDALKKRFIDLDNQFKSVITSAKTKEVLISHAALGYWEERYGIKQISVTGIQPSDEPSQKELTNIAKIAKEHNLKYILFETFTTPKIAEVIQKETGTKILRYNHLSTISEEDVKNNKDYFALMEENIKTLKEATN